MEIGGLLKVLPEPPKYMRENKECYYDNYRKKLIEITPEEVVRQKVALLFEKHYHVPKEMIVLEVPMSHYVEGTSGRADIIIHMVDEEGYLCPLAIIECKQEEVVLTDKVVDQAIRYREILYEKYTSAKYIAITNGIVLEMAVYDEELGEYRFLDNILTYEKMVSEDYVIPENIEYEFSRFSMKELLDQTLLREYNEGGSWIFGEGTSQSLRTFAINFYQALLDVDHRLPKVKRKTFELIDDIGLRYMDYGNAGGGHYIGDYRSFLVNDRNGEPQIISLSLFGTDANFRGENRNSYTSLVVSVDKFKTSHNSLQYNVDRFAVVNPSGVISFSHNGQIGNYKSSKVIDEVVGYGDGVYVVDDKIMLGEIDNSKLIYLDDVEVAEFIYNLIEYALLRENVRKS